MPNTPPPDANETAARIAVQSTANADRLPADVEAAWEAWVAGVGKVDDRARLLLRAAFEVGVDAGRVLNQRQNV